MRSLRRRKVTYSSSVIPINETNILVKAKQGITSESVKAITEKVLQDLYVYNALQPADPRLQRLSSTQDGSRLWGGYRKRIMMQLIYALSFRCFFRIDETLRLEVRHLRLDDAQNGVIELILDYRKTAQ
jgi:hypothetical protein